MPHRYDLLNVLLWSLLAGLGGTARYVATSLRQSGPYVFSRTSVSLYMLKLSANACISGFSGLMGALLISTITDQPTWHFVAAGAFGYLGVEGLDYISRYVRDKFLPGR